MNKLTDMKQLLTIFLLIAGLAASAQDSADHWTSYFSDVVDAGKGKVYIIIDYKDRTHLIDSGRICIIGDTLAAMRELFRNFEFQSRRSDSVVRLAERVMFIASLNTEDSCKMVCLKKALRSYCKYVYGDTERYFVGGRDLSNCCRMPKKQRNKPHP